MRRKLTDAWLRVQKPPATGRIEVHDADCRGLVLRLTAGGAATWVLRMRTRDGRETRVSLGNYPAAGLRAARDAAEVVRGRIKAGADPVAERRQTREERKRRQEAASAAEGETVAARLAEWQAARVADPSPPWSPRYAAEVRRVCEQAVVPKLGGKLLRETTRQDWTTLIQGWKRTVATRPRGN